MFKALRIQSRNVIVLLILGAEWGKKVVFHTYPALKNQAGFFVKKIFKVFVDDREKGG